MQTKLIQNSPTTLSEIDCFLNENNLNIRFSLLKKIYYQIIRPVLPVKIKHALQNYYTKKIKYYDNFIWNELIEYLKHEDEIYSQFINHLYPDQYTTAIVLTHDVETAKGLDFIPSVIDLEKKYNFKASWNIVPFKYIVREDILKIILKNGHEIGIHGYNHDGKLYYSKQIFDKRAPYINEALIKYGAVGFRSPIMHRNLKWLQQLNIEYDASCFDYDPFQPFPGGTGSIWPFKAGRFIELPYTIPQDHVLFYIFKKKDINIWKNKAHWVSQNHGVILTLTHPDYLIEKDHLKLYEEFLAWLSEIKNSWHCLPREIASYWKDKIEKYK